MLRALLLPKVAHTSSPARSSDAGLFFWICFDFRYFGGRNSPFNQPMVLSVFRGSGPSQAKHFAVGLPLPTEAKTK